MIQRSSLVKKKNPFCCNFLRLLECAFKQFFPLRVYIDGCEEHPKAL
jgi:hypothetical protein